MVVWHCFTTTEVLKELDVDAAVGLSSSEAEKRLRENGPNMLKEQPHKSFFLRFILQFSDFLVIILLIAAVVSFWIAVQSKDGEYLDSVFILIIVTANALMGAVQESKAEKAIHALKKISSPKARVKRNGETVLLDSQQVVPGDILILEAGDYVPADARLIQTFNTKAEEAALTGESVPVEKDYNALFTKNTQLGDRKNMVFATSLLTCGRAAAVAVETGMNTQVGRIAGMLNEEVTPQTPLQKRLEQVGRVLGTAAVVICAVIFIMGLLQKRPMLEMFMNSVGLAVAAIPEGMTAVVTIMLAIGVQRMVKKNAIIRNLSAVETLGSATVICSDKTGTLTQNKMKVMKLVQAGEIIEASTAVGTELLALAALCSDSSLSRQNGELKVQGDPTENAMVIAAAEAGRSKKLLDRHFPRVGEIPFDSERKLMTTIHKIGTQQYRIITKGAPEMLLKRCSRVRIAGREELLTAREISRISSMNAQLSGDALRTIGVASRLVGAIPSSLTCANIETSLTFEGLIGLMDPPRPEVRDAVRICKKAGVKVVMITGDHIETAKAVARELDILEPGSKAMMGEELSLLPQDKLEKVIGGYNVFARISPEHKVRIIKALQKSGEVVAMTGDGVNDAPALKSADIGCAMGITGTDVAKGASDMVLTDDNFATIVSAIREGRGIYANIKKAVHFLLASNIGEIVSVFVATMLNWPAPLLAIQLLWVNLITDSLPAISLGLEKPAVDIMEKRPVDPEKNIFSDNMGLDILIEGLLIGVVVLLAFSAGRLRFDLPGEATVGRTMAFAVMSITELFYAFNKRSEKPVFEIGVFSNIYLVGAFILGVILQAAVITIKPLANIFKVVPLSIGQWIIVFSLSLGAFVLFEIQKAFTSSRRIRQKNKTIKASAYGGKSPRTDGSMHLRRE